MESENMNANDLDALIQRNPLEIKIGKKYSFNELTDVWIVIRKKQATYFNTLLSLDKIVIRCSGKINQTATTEPNVLIDVKTLMQIFQRSQTCNFNFKFIMINLNPSDKKFEAVLYDQCKERKLELMKEKILQIQSYILKEVNVQHSKECVASNIHFVYQRNYNFLRNNQNLLEKLIHNKYLEDNKKPIYPNGYLQYTKDFFGFDYLFYGFGQLSDQQQNALMKILKKTYDNIVACARKFYKMQATPTKSYSKKRKAKFRLLKQDQQQVINYLSQNEEKRQLKSDLKNRRKMKMIKNMSQNQENQKNQLKVEKIVGKKLIN